MLISYSGMGGRRVEAHLFVGRLFDGRLWLGKGLRLRRWRFDRGWGGWIGVLGSWVGGHGVLKGSENWKLYEPRIGRGLKDTWLG